MPVKQRGTNLPLLLQILMPWLRPVPAHQVDMILVGPEEPLVKGMYDHFKNNPATKHIAVIGPSKKLPSWKAARLLQRNSWNVTGYQAAACKNSADNYEEGGLHQTAFIAGGAQADGLAAGKGVVICQHTIEACQSLTDDTGFKFGEAGKSGGEEFPERDWAECVCAYRWWKLCLLPRKDYKRVGKGDTGLNTMAEWGQWALCHLPMMPLQKWRRVIEPTVAGLKKTNWIIKGFIFQGWWMITAFRKWSNTIAVWATPKRKWWSPAAERPGGTAGRHITTTVKRNWDQGQQPGGGNRRGG